MHPSLAQRVEAWWDTKPLASQLVTLITFLLAVGLSLSGTVMIGLLQRHLTSQIDDQLIATAHTIQISASSATFAADGQGAQYATRCQTQWQRAGVIEALDLMR